MPIEYLLTLAIPTYNRAAILDETIQCLVSNPDFNERVEIIVSDNNSSDNTQQVVEKYANLYPNIKYYRNSENICDANFAKALYYGTGHYVRLFNDTLRFREGMLKFMLAKIEEHLHAKPTLYFYQNDHRYENTKHQSVGVDEFINSASFSCTWIANFGVWRTEIPLIKDINRSDFLKLAQVDWSLQLSQNDSGIIFYYQKYYDVFQVSKKGDYNIFQVFANNYLSLIQPYLENHQVSFLTYQKEKYRLFRYFIFRWLVTLFIKDKGEFTYSKDDFRKILFSHYKYCFYFYLYFVVFGIKYISYGLKSLKK